MNRTKIITSHVRHILKRAGEGQGLVELMIIMPLLLLFFIGVFEVGWALRGYLVLTNANREITRFAVRPGYLDYSDYSLALDNVETIGYDSIANHLFTVLGRDPTDPAASPGQLPVELGQNSTLIISHIVAETGQPCRLITDCNCDWFEDDPNGNWQGTDYRKYPDDSSYPWDGKLMLLDDLIIHPGQTGKEFHAATYPPTSTVTTRLDYEPYAMEMARQNDKFNCELLKKTDSAVPSANNVVVTELFYDQPQLIGFPGLSNSLTDPLPMYSQTTMRLTVGARGGNVDTTGEVCAASPIIVYEDDVDTWTEGDVVDILGGPNSSDYGWLSYNPQETSNTYLQEQIEFENAPLNDYVNPADSSDTSLNPGDYVRSMSGFKNVGSAVLDYLVGREVIVPVYDNFVHNFPNSNPPPVNIDVFQISGFIKARVTADYDNSSKTIMAEYLGPATSACE